MRTFRLLAIGLLLLLAVFILWRGARLAWLAWQTTEAIQRLEAQGSALKLNSGDSTTQLIDLPALRDDLLQFDQRLQSLASEARPLAPLLRGLGEFPPFGDIPQWLDTAQRMSATVLRIEPQAEWLLGAETPRRYLLLVQNNHELRATGGFISAFGYLVLDEGKIVDLEFVDSYALFSIQSEYPFAPAPMQQYMGIQLLVPRDANWSPDLPANVAELIRLYMQDSGRTVDGIITLDLHAVRHLVSALGSLNVEGVNTPVTAANVEDVLVRLWESPVGGGETAASGSLEWRQQRKDFVSLVAGAALARIQAGDFDPPRLLIALAAALDDRSIQMWLDQPQLQAVLAEQGWDGGLHPEANADFLAVVDANVGYNKVDAAIQRSLDYRVTWPDGPDAGGQAVLSLTYTHPFTSTESGCDPTPRYGNSYADMIARCYFDYVRVYAPAGSRLLDVEGIEPEDVTSAAGEQGTQQFAGYFVLAPNSTKTIRWTYRLPASLTPDSYDLRIQRQAGTDPLPLRVTVNGVERSDVLSYGVWRWRDPQS